MRPHAPVLAALAVTAFVAAAPPGAGAQAFAPPVNVSQSASGSYLPSMVIDRAGPDAGALRLFWHDFTSSPNLNWCSDTTATPGTFSPGAPCAPINVTQSYSPRAASASDGTTHVAWRDRTGGQDDVFHASFDGIAWSAPVNVSRTPGASRNPAIAVDPWGRPHLVWEEDPGTGVRFWESHFDGTAWSPAADTGLPFVNATFLDTIRIACDGAGTLHAAWQDGATSATDVFHAQRPDGGSWSAPENVSATPGSYSVEPSLAVGPGDELHLAWVEQEATTGASAEICASTLPSGGSWAPRRELTQLRTGAFHPCVAVGADDVERVAFGSGPVGAREVLFLTDLARTPVNVSASPATDSDRASLVLDELDRAWVAWQEGSPPTPEILVAGPDVAPPAPILLLVTKEGADVRLDWTGGASPWTVRREDDPATPEPWTELASGLAAPTHVDPGLVGEGLRLRCWDIR